MNDKEEFTALTNAIDAIGYAIRLIKHDLRGTPNAEEWLKELRETEAKMAARWRVLARQQ